MMSVSYDHLFKLLLLGDEAVGKSSILLRFIDNDFNEIQPSTIGVDFKVKMITIGDKIIKATVWDTAGQERFRTLTNSFYRGAQGIVLVYDVTRRSSFDNINQWLNEVERYRPSDEKDTVVVLCGNKIDLDGKREVATKEGQAFAKRHGMIFIEVSAKTKLGIQQVFEEMIMKILDNPLLANTGLSSYNGIRSANLVENKVNESDGMCC